MIRLPDLPRPLVAVRTQRGTVNLILLDFPLWILDEPEPEPPKLEVVE